MDDLISRDAVKELLNNNGLPHHINPVLWEELNDLPSAQPEIIRCKDCKYWVPGYITDNDDFIPPKCGEWQQMVGHSSDDYCSLAERREVTT